MISITLINDVEILFIKLEGHRLIPTPDNLEICLHGADNPVQIQCTCEPEDIKLYIQQHENHLIIPNHLIRGIESLTVDPNFVGNSIIGSEQEHGFSLN